MKSFNKPQIYILDASAGTGKTYNLAKRYISYLFSASSFSDMPFKNILAITFTNKAMIEMKSRILEFLKRIYLDIYNTPNERKNFLSEIFGEAYNEEEIRQKSLYLIESILKNFSLFQVQTIDSFINSIITNCSFLLNIQPDFKIEQKLNQYMGYCIDLLIDKSLSSSKLQRIFKDFIYNYLLVEGRKSWFPKRYIFSLSNTLYEQKMRYGKDFKTSSSQKIHKELKQMKQNLISYVKEFYSKINPNLFHKKFIEALEKFIKQNTDEFSFITTKNLSEFFFRDPPLKVSYSIIEKDIKILWRKIRKHLLDLLEYEAFNIYNSYIEIFKNLEKELKVFTKMQNFIFLEELNIMLRKLLSTEMFPEIYFRLSSRIYYYLIDEFQDTSRLQWLNIYPLIEEAIAKGGSFFFVGDRKQSIYRFRGGEPSLFDEIVKVYFPNYEYKLEVLNINFRSKKEIVDFNNLIFSLKNLEKFCELCGLEENIKSEIKRVYSNAQQTTNSENEGGYVYGELLNFEEEEDLDVVVKPKLLSLIKEINIEAKDLSKIAILVRTNKEVKLITEWLVEENYPVESESTLDITENKYIKEIFALLKFLYYLDEFYFTTFILGDIFIKATGKTKEEIHNFILISNPNSILNSFKQKYKDIWEKYFLKLLNSVELIPLYDLVIEIYSLFKIFENFSEYQGFFMLLLELINKNEKEDCSIGSFIDYFESNDEKISKDFFVEVKKGNSIKVMTIHKAKGLEFDIVILPLLRVNIDIAKYGFLIFENGDFLNLVKANKKLAQKVEKIKKVYNNEFKKLLIDELNTIYVGFTRAKHQLYFFVLNEDKNYAKFLIPWENAKFLYGKKTFSFKEDLKNNFSFKYPISIYKNWIENLKEESIPQRKEMLYRDKILQGEVLHKILSFIDNIYNKNLTNLIEAALKKTKVYFPYINDWNYYRTITKKFLSQRNIKKYFSIPSKAEIYTEKEVVDSFGLTKRIDRIIILEKEIWILDFKLSLDKDMMDNYLKQIQEYKNIVKEIYKDKNVKSFLIFLDSFKVVNV